MLSSIQNKSKKYTNIWKILFGVSLVITGECAKRVKEVCDLLIIYLEKNNGNPRLF